MSYLLSQNNYFPDNNDSNSIFLENNSIESNYLYCNLISLDKVEFESELFNRKYKQESLFKDEEDPITINKNEINFTIKGFNNKFFFNILQEENKSELSEKTSLNNQKDKKNDGNPPFFSFHEIIQLLDTKIEGLNLKNLLIQYQNFPKSERSIQIEFLKKKKKRKGDIYENISINLNDKQKMKRGRKTDDNKSKKEEHTKYRQDNISKKIKKNLLENALLFLNTILNLKKRNRLLKLDYKSNVDKINTNNDFHLFRLSLGQLFSKNISCKNKTKPKEYNKIIIQKILKQEKITNTDFNTIKFVLNLTLNDFYEAFIMKKTVDNLAEKVDFSIDVDKVRQSIPGIEKLLKEIKNKGDDKYFIYFIFLLYNFERWLLAKKSREKR